MVHKPGSKRSRSSHNHYVVEISFYETFAYNEAGCVSTSKIDSFEKKTQISPAICETVQVSVTGTFVQSDELNGFMRLICIVIGRSGKKKKTTSIVNGN